jgi:hypothetical protein
MTAALPGMMARTKASLPNWLIRSLFRPTIRCLRLSAPGQRHFLSRGQHRYLGADPGWRRNWHGMEQSAGEQGRCVHQLPRQLNRGGSQHSAKHPGQVGLCPGGINRRFGNFFTAYASPSAAADPTGQVFYTYTSREIYRTANAGGLWTDIGHTTIPGSGTPPGPSTPPSPGINAARIFRDTPHGIGVSPLADGQNHVAVVCNGGFVVATHNGGATWTQAALIGTVPGWQGFNSTAEWADNTTLYIGSESPCFGFARG